jgi:hypothetical protein
MGGFRKRARVMQLADCPFRTINNLACHDYAVIGPAIFPGLGRGTETGDQMRIAAIIALAGAVAGCAEYEQQQAAAQAASDDAQCRSYGAAPGSQAYIQCRMNIDNQRAQMRAAFIGAVLAPRQQPQIYNVNICNVPGQVNTCMYPR